MTYTWKSCMTCTSRKLDIEKHLLDCFHCDRVFYILIYTRFIIIVHNVIRRCVQWRAACAELQLTGLKALSSKIKGQLKECSEGKSFFQQLLSDWEVRRNKDKQYPSNQSGHLSEMLSSCTYRTSNSCTDQEFKNFGRASVSWTA